ncbi:MAG TPA: GAF domain-containing protein [Vicinamibacterales bacterium]|nr:GAF domain-containing protein [Vicinamibacterales bacterium]
MRHRNLGLLFAFIVLLAIGTLVQNFRFDQSLARTRASAAAVDHRIGTAEVTLSDFRAAQTAYLATGQGPDFWMQRAGELSGQIDTAIGDLRQTADDDVRTHYEAASAALQALLKIDGRARDDIQNDQRFMASDLILTDSTAPAQQLTAALEAARTAEASAADAHIVRTSRIRLAMNGLAFLVLIAVTSSVARRKPAQTAVSARAETAEMIRNLPPPVKTGITPVARPVPAPIASLPDAAELCVDLARVIDSRDVQTLLERAARVLEAKGVIIWMADKDQGTLQPTLTHGYSDNVLTRLGVLDVDADNVTSLSYRSMRPQTMTAMSIGSAGAIAVPLITAAGCTGVLAVETRDSKPASEMVAVARIIAAQFATLIAPGEFAAAPAAAQG